MSREVFITETNCITPLGFTLETNIQNIEMMKSPFYASIIDDESINSAFAKVSKSSDFTRLEKMMILALQPIVEKSKDRLNAKTGFILSTTKGNITALKNQTQDNLKSAQLSELAKKVFSFFGFHNEPIVVSNACVSGILAISIAKRLIQSEMYDNILIVAGDEVSEFVLSGFNSFQAISDLPCKPYSKNRNGVTLGEATTAVLVSANVKNAKVKIIGDGSINDANHISGPSRTGEGLFRSIKNALQEAKINPNQIDYISAHGTATPFNDEMEGIAINRMGLENVPVNSLKGFYGHTLGASGLLETVIGIESALRNKLYASIGFDETNLSQPIAIIEKNQNREINYFLKTASGFGGCNTAVVFEKVKI